MFKFKLNIAFKLLFLYVIVLNNNVYGQYFAHKNFNTKEGIARGHHGYIIQDHRGYIWTTSQGGLTRFDGQSAKVFTYDHTNNRVLDINEQSPVFESKDSLIWIGGYDGLYMYDAVENSFKFWGQDSSNTKGPSIPELTYILEDKNNILWIACYGGLYSFDRKNNIWDYYDPLPDIAYKNKHHSEKSIRVLSLDKYNDDILWLGGQSRIYKFDIDSKKYLKKYDLKVNFTFRVNTFALLQISPNQFYIGSYGNGLELFDAQSGNLTGLVSESDIIIEDKPFKIVRDIIKIDSNKLLCTNYSGSLFIYDISTHDVNYLDDINVNKRSHQIIKDRDDNFWVTFAEGITKLKPAYIKKFKPGDINKKYDIVFSVNDYKNNCHLSYTTGSTLTLECFDNKNNRYVDIGRNFKHSYTDFCFDTVSQKFLIVCNDTLFRFSSRDFSPKVFFKVKEKGYQQIIPAKDKIYLEKNEILDVYDRKGTLIKQYKIPSDLVDAKSMQGYSKYSVLGNNQVFFINRNKIIRCGDNGEYEIVLYEPQLNIQDFIIIDSIAFITTRTGLRKAVLQNGKLSLDKNFLNPYKSQEFKRIQRDGDVIYIQSFSSIVGYNFKTDKRVLLINENDGISTISDFDYHKGKLYGYDTKEYFEIDLKDTNEKITDIVIDELIVPNSGNKLKDYNGLNLNHNQNAISLSWRPIFYGNQDEIKYSYRLIGYNDTWIQNGNSTRVSFNKLKSGNYDLEIKADAIGHSFEKSIISFSIAPPWWKTWWFYLISLIGLSVFIYFFNKSRVNKIKLKSLHKQQLAELELNALRAQMNPHFIFNSLNSIKRLIQKNDSENAIDYLTNFSMMIRQILSNSDKKLISLKDELDFSKRYLNMEKLRFQEKFNWEIDVDENIKPDDILIPPLILQPYIENALWHGIMHSDKPGVLKISVIENNNCIQIRIDDNGIGRKKSEEYSTNTLLTKKSRGMDMSEKRGQLSSLLFNNNIVTRIIDKNENGQALGTTVVIDFLNCNK